MRVVSGLVFCLVTALALAAPAARAADPHGLEIASKTGVHSFTVEIADTEASRAKGLMFRKSLPEGTGMLFDFKSEQPVGFWMENTYIPLDMIFIRADGRIAKIVENTKPLSKDIIPSGVPVLAVLEVAGGTARKLGIEPGDRVANPIFHRN
ncbi:MAG: DUF192 domain-containing protein [Pseudolabrys sp.]|jgi:uncharacterized membrane protein (UPF0127 family)|nr:DUF192 domain-containing protein [Pseudolabrys sp.]